MPIHLSMQMDASHQIGVEPVYGRSSGVVNANGECLSLAATTGEVDWYEVCRQGLLDFRKGFSTRQNRRSDFYREVIR